MARDKFRDGMEGGLGEYEWDVGHETEDPQAKTGNLERTALTTGEGFVRQQGAPTPTVFKLGGWIVEKAQKEKMEAFYNACQGIGTPARTIFWTDIENGEHEVLITEFSPQRVIGRAGATGLGYVWKYSITLEIIA
jgi:hypothetical protein